MTDTHSADPGADVTSEAVQINIGGEPGVISAREAAQRLASFRHKRQEADTETPQATERPEAAAPEPAHESADEADAAPLETEATGETQAADPVEEPLLELPRS